MCTCFRNRVNLGKSTIKMLLHLLMGLTLIHAPVDLTGKCLNKINSAISMCLFEQQMFSNVRVKSDKQQPIHR